MRTYREETELASGHRGDSTSRVYAELKRMAINYEFHPQARLNEVELAQRLQVSRTPVREALNRLVVEGFMTAVSSKGFFSRTFDSDEIHNLFEVRCHLEVQAAQSACDRASDDELADLVAWTAAAGDQAVGSTAEALTQLDEEFHARIAALTRNAEIVRLLASIGDRIHFVRRIEVDQPARRSTTFAEHAVIADSLARRDGGQAAALLRRHIEMSVSDALRVVKEGLAHIYLPPRSTGVSER